LALRIHYITGSLFSVARCAVCRRWKCPSNGRLAPHTRTACSNIIVPWATKRRPAITARQLSLSHYNPADRRGYTCSRYSIQYHPLLGVQAAAQCQVVCVVFCSI